MDYIYTDEPVEQAADKVAKVLIEHLSKGECVLWLLSGGSSLPIAILAADKLKNVDLSNLYVSLTDERYGPIGHKDENWQQLLDDGLTLPGATLYRPMIDQDIEKTTSLFNQWLKLKFGKADFKLGIFGIGSDGHTAGIKPHSPAVVSSDFATYYTGDDYQRVTISFTAITQIDEVIIQVSGENKKVVVNKFVHDDLPLDDQPAQILKTVPKATLYTNNKEEYR